MLDVIDNEPFPGLKRNVVETIVLEYPVGDREVMRWTHDGQEILFERVADAAMLEEALGAENPIAEEVPTPPSEEGFRQAGIKKMMGGNSWISLTDWPDEELPENFKSTKLQTLSIRRGNLKRLPADLAERFPNLEFLALERVPFEACPEGLEQLSHLSRLWLIGMKLNELPDARLENLRELKLSDNRLKTVPSGWLASGQLVLCDLSNNRFAQVPPDLEHQPQLETLNLSANAISELKIGNWPMLRVLNAKENHVRELSIQTKNLPELGGINLAGNRLGNLPDALEGFIALRSINLSHNDFKDVPEVLERMPELKFVTLYGSLISQKRLSEIKEKNTGYRIEPMR